MEQCYGTFNNYNIQNIKPNDSFVFEKNNNLKNIFHQNDAPVIKILKEGYYVLNVILFLEDKGTVAFYKNDKVIEKTIVESNEGTNIVFIHEIIALKENDEITLRNYSEHTITLNNKYHHINLDLIISLI